MKVIENKKGEILVISLYNTQLLMFTANDIATKLNFTNDCKYDKNLELDSIWINYSEGRVSLCSSRVIEGAIKDKYLLKSPSDTNNYSFSSIECLNIVSLMGVEPMVEYATKSKLKYINSHKSTTMESIHNKKGTTLIISFYEPNLGAFIAETIATTLGFKNMFKSSVGNSGNEIIQNGVVVSYRDKVVTNCHMTSTIGLMKINSVINFYKDREVFLTTDVKDIEVLKINEYSDIQKVLDYAIEDKPKMVAPKPLESIIGGFYGQSYIKVRITKDKVVVCIDGDEEVDINEIRRVVRTRYLKVGPWNVNANGIIKIGCKFVEYDQLQDILDKWSSLQS